MTPAGTAGMLHAEEAAMDGPHLIYFSDPMCSWCYGFSPVIEQVRVGAVALHVLPPGEAVTV